LIIFVRKIWLTNHGHILSIKSEFIFNEIWEIKWRHHLVFEVDLILIHI